MEHRLKALTVSTLSCLACATGFADTVRTVWHVPNLAQYDYATGQYVTPTVPTAFDVTVDFPLVVSRVVDYGTTTITDFGTLGETSFSSPLTQYIGADPYGSGLTGQVPYTFPNVSDYTSTFFEEFAAQSNAYSYSSSENRHWSYHIEIRARRYSSSLGGTGAADYAFTPQLLTEFLADVEANPTAYQFIFNESWEQFDRTTMQSLAGVSWASYNNVRLVSWEVIKDVDPPQMFDDLLAKVVGVGPGSSLADKITLSQTYYSVPDLTSACLMLADFDQQVTAQTGKKIDATLAAELIDDASALSAVIGCQ